MNIYIGITTGIVLLIAVIADLRNSRIPNALTYGAIILGIVLNSIFDGGHGTVMAVEGTAAGAGLLLLPFIMGGMGGGDLKLMAAVGSLMGPFFALLTFLIGSVAGGFVAVGRLFFMPGERVAAASRLRTDLGLLSMGVIPEPDPARHGFPYAGCIAAGAVCAYIIQMFSLLQKLSLIQK